MLGPLFVLATAVAFAQDPPGRPPGPRPSQGEALRVFLDCQYECDLDYLRTEITFVNWVRDRYDGQVLVLVTSQTTGGRGTDYTLTFIGQKDLAGRTDTLHYVTPQGATGDDTRRGMARILRLGLVRYTMATPLAAHLDVRFAPPGGPGGPGGPGREQRDPWHRWVYSAGLNSYFNGQESYSDRQFSGSLSASRITEAWKIELSAYNSDYRSRYTYQVTQDSTYQLSPGHDTTVSFLADTTTRAARQSWSGSARVVASLGAHWSAGLQAALSGSTSANTDLKANVMPAIEYDLYPYAQSTRRQLRFNYSFGVETARYHDTTVYFRTSETYLKHELDVALGLRQPWGSASLSLAGTQYWNDAKHPNLDLYGSLSVRLIRGLSANAWGGYSFVRSQRYLRAASATPEDVLLQLQQLRTAYQYYGGFGFSYTFGSVYNNVVNPRFGSSGGGGMTIIMN
jgi:hypothetical protein